MIAEDQSHLINKANPESLKAVRTAIDGWVRSLIDTTGRNPLLYLKTGSNLTLESANDKYRAKLIAGEGVNLTDLFPEVADRGESAKKVANLYKRMKAYDEERGVNVGKLVSGLVQWSEQDSTSPRSPNAPLLMRELFISQPLRGSKEFVIRADQDVEINEVLLHLFAKDFKQTMSSEQLEELLEIAQDDFYPADSAVKFVERHFSNVEGIQVKSGISLGSFLYQKLPMVKDLQNNMEEFAKSDLVAAVAGSKKAIQSIRASIGDVSRSDPDTIPPVNEFLVLDADPSQNYAINAVLAGRNVIIQGPPGTGKSQTISNLIAASIAKQKTVLFVAEKRAAIEAVTSRLHNVGLGSQILDLHDGAKNKAKVTSSIKEAIDQAGQIPPADVEALNAKLVKARSAQIEHVDSLHTAREPWQLSIFELQNYAFDAPADCALLYEFTSEALSNLDARTSKEVCSLLEEAASLEAFKPLERRTSWATATEIDVSNAHSAFQHARTIKSSLLPQSLRDYNDLMSASETTEVESIEVMTRRLERFKSVNKLLSKWNPEVLDADLGMLIQRTASWRLRRSNDWLSTWSERKKVRRQANSWRRTRASARVLHKELQQLEEESVEWQKISSKKEGTPRIVEIDAAYSRHSQLVEALQGLGEVLQRSDLPKMTTGDLTYFFSELLSDPSQVTKISRLNAVRLELNSLGLTPLFEETQAIGKTWSVDEAMVKVPQAFRHAWARGVLDHLAINSSYYGNFDGERQSRNASTFVQSDLEHRNQTAHRILRACAEHLGKVRSINLDEDTQLGRELQRRRKIQPLRKLISGARNVIPAAKPCWVMSPLVVSQALPADVKFDLVIFDEASQIRPADAIPSLGRAHQAVICGDSKQMPPTNAFMGTDQDDIGLENDDEDESLMGPLSTDSESILDVFDAALGSTLASEYRLLWHYRSADARLINFSNRWFYSNSLVSFPGIESASPLSHKVVAHPRSQPQTVANEVSEVVELVMEHARERANRSLGVIAMSLEHARRIESALDTRLGQENDPSVKNFFAEGGAEPFFIKNLERVQGDERDTIVISMGYVKEPDGRMLHRFGPLNVVGGERRLNVAVTRAKLELVFVSSFTADDLDPNKLTSEGGKALRSYIQYAASGGQSMGEVGGSDRPLNPFEMHVQDRLNSAGIPVVPQYGVAGYWIDFAASHPKNPGKMVLAIEADGASYHSSETARARDRLRQEHLERLGWRFHRIWSTDYFRNPDRVVAEVKDAYDRAVKDCDSKESGRERFSAQDMPLESRQPTIPEPVKRSVAFPVRQKDSIGDYSPQALAKVIEWVMSDSLIRTDDEIMSEAISGLGFSRRGPRIVEALSIAIRTYRKKTA